MGGTGDQIFLPESSKTAGQRVCQGPISQQDEVLGGGSATGHSWVTQLLREGLKSC